MVRTAALFGFLIITMLAPVARAEPPTATETEAVYDILFRCARKNIMLLDDGLSQANIVARAAVARCNKEITALYNVRAKGLGKYELRGFNSVWNPEDLFTDFVLTDRVRKRSAPTK